MNYILIFQYKKIVSKKIKSALNRHRISTNYNVKNKLVDIFSKNTMIVIKLLYLEFILNIISF